MSNELPKQEVFKLSPELKNLLVSYLLPDPSDLAEFLIKDFEDSLGKGIPLEKQMQLIALDAAACKTKDVKSFLNQVQIVNSNAIADRIITVMTNTPAKQLLIQPVAKKITRNNIGAGHTAYEVKNKGENRAAPIHSSSSFAGQLTTPPAPYSIFGFFQALKHEQNMVTNLVRGEPTEESKQSASTSSSTPMALSKTSIQAKTVKPLPREIAETHPLQKNPISSI